MKKLTKKQKAFADEYLDSGIGVQSALKTYDTDDYFTANAIASENIKKPLIQQYLADKSNDAASMVYKLSQTAKMEPVRLAASKDILDRAGYKAVEKSINVTAQINIENKEQLEALASKMLEELKTNESNS